MTGRNKVFNVKAVIDKEKDRVVFVESDHDFVDVLLSFLTLPIGTVIRLIQKDENIATSSSTVFRCMTNLYDSVKNLEAHHLNTEECKSMLLFPRREAELMCMHLKLNIEDREPTNFYVCENHPDTISYSKRLPCSCGSSSHKRKILSKSKSLDRIAVFAKQGHYVITDDMHVKEGSMDTCLSVLGMKGITDWSRLEERTVDLRLKEVLLLLKHSLCSKSPLTNVILGKDESSDTVIKSEHKEITQHPSGRSPASDVTSKISVKLVVRKSNNEVLYAVAKEDFLDFLFSFLTFPLSSIIKLCGGSSSMLCLDNLYKSVGDLSSADQITSEECEAYLVHPKLVPHFGCDKNQVFFEEGVGQHGCTDQINRKTVILTNPKSTNPGETGGGYFKGPSTFMVTNELVATPFCLTSGLFLLKRLNVPINDVEERVISIGKQEALNLLKASLISDAPLSSIINPNKQNCRLTPKKEVVD